ncbi:aminotransferase class I/II-fold pyridoxal phosphate-dependent enzyme [Thorsellia anophelis]|uniref:UDP-4-amino-4-deoxy-L-arabinose-oxoglutarate aminotransferase n=1 Tax=Thorsellia anophelis DSM 18579 TaxID=1123402 RepID=A0A1I0BMV1_9GAMM|nr:aminotransferase class I/II-fold pyridoxal phosphate-dependent enzyme [Thorsellia anophelis]SET08325.1 UDP-4-amino-4-deoxy-L-arabinose-oxoglutarate aminotransferase [Thorsellia anophelis DSM 18579]
MSNYLPFSRPYFDEKESQAILKVLESGWITTGTYNQQLEEHFAHLLKAKHAIALSSATAGMHLTLYALGIGPGDEVITPSMTWVSTANMIRLVGADPIFVDIDINTLLISTDAIKKAITKRTKAIIPVHFAGVPCNLEEIYQIGKDYGIQIIEDAAHAIGSVYKNEIIGQRGTAIFSLHAIKNITCAEGGIVVTDNNVLAKRLRQLKFHGIAQTDIDQVTRQRKPTAEVIEPGFKYNLSDLHAAIGCVQIEKLNYINRKRALLAEHYLKKIDTEYYTPLSIPNYDHLHAWHLFIIRINTSLLSCSREDLMNFLKEHGIHTGLHFKAIHTHRYYQKHLNTNTQSPNNLTNTEWNDSRILSLPLFPDMTVEDADRVINILDLFTRSRNVLK